jgi:hypothetical protein
LLFVVVEYISGLCQLHFEWWLLLMVDARLLLLLLLGMLILLLLQCSAAPAYGRCA